MFCHSDTPLHLGQDQKHEINLEFYVKNVEEKSRLIAASILLSHTTCNELPSAIPQEEFLLSGPTNTMGMIVTAEGLSQHQPLNWADGMTAIAHAYPYALVLGNSTITVHR